MAILKAAEFADSIVLHVEFPQIDAVFEAVHISDEIIEQIDLSNILQSLEGEANTSEIVVL